MTYLNSIDYAVLIVYFIALLGLGIFLQKKASNSIQDYFLGGRKLPWWALGISGMASFLDIAGTMLIVSFLFMLGPRGLFIEIRGGAALVLSFAMAWTAKWHYRSKVMTGAEWMEYRFGSKWGGKFARLIAAISMVFFTIGMLAYLVKGVGLFISMFLPFSPFESSLILLSIATIYTVTSGFYGVVYTDIFQAGIIIVSVVIISVMAFLKVDNAQELANIAFHVTGNKEWISSTLQWHTYMPPGYQMYQDLMLFVIFYLLRLVVGSLGYGADPKYFGAKSEREVGLTNTIWIFFMMFRWPFMIGFAVLGLFFVNNSLPGHDVQLQIANLIKQYNPDVTLEQWPTLLASIINSPQHYSVEMINTIKDVFQTDWAAKLNMISFDGTINAERILPAIILFDIPTGLRGLILVAIIAASMSTFDTTVNTTAGYFIRDIYQRYLRPKASNRELILSSYFISILLIIFGFLMAYTIKSINDIWGWIMMSLGSGLSTALMLKFYWWRYNGEGFAIGTIIGMLIAVLQRFLFPDMIEWVQFILIFSTTFISIIITTLLTKPPDEKVVRKFYEETRPFGFWKPYKKNLSNDVLIKMKKEHRNDIISLPFILLAQVSLFLMPMQLIIHTFHTFWITLSIFIVAVLGIYWFWYRNLDDTPSKT